MKLLAATLACFVTILAPACELCTIYNIENAYNGRTESSSGFLFALSEQYIPFGTLQVEGRPYPPSPFFHTAYLDSSMTHFVPGYNFSSQFGVSLNISYAYRDFRRTEITPFGERIVERGTRSEERRVGKECRS